MKKLVLLVLLLLIGGVIIPSAVTAKPEIQVEFPSPVPLTLEAIPVKITIPYPDGFGYPRVPVALKVSIAGFRNSGVLVPLLLKYNVNLSDPKSVYSYLTSPIVEEVSLPLPVRKIGFYSLVVDIQCLYGPHYRWNYWYSYTANQGLEITTEKIHIVSGPEIIYNPTNVLGYFGKNYGTFKMGEGYIDVVDVLSENGFVIDKVSVIRFGNDIQKVISSSNMLWKPERYEIFLGSNSYSLWRLRKYTPVGKFYGYTFSQAIIYDWYKKGINFRFKVQVVANDIVLYEEPSAIIGTAFEESLITEAYIQKESQELKQKYIFLLNMFPNEKAEIKVIFEKGDKGNWRWLFSTQPPSWVAEKGVVIEVSLPQTKEGEPFFTGLDKIEWRGIRWSPSGEFQLEVLSN